jgi:hypothetical protein
LLPALSAPAGRAAERGADRSDDGPGERDRRSMLTPAPIAVASPARNA